MLPIKGLQKTSLVDFPPYTAATIFIGGCNFRCPFCHNPALISAEGISMSEEQIFSFLLSRKKWLDGVCVTGGEPTLYTDIVPFFEKIKGMGLLVKLDTNGSNPALLLELIEKKLVDYVAMDIKNSPEKYAETAVQGVDMGKINQSITVLKEGRVDYEFRTTIVPFFHSADDIKAIGSWLNGAKKYCLQQFGSEKELLEPGLQKSKTYKKTELLEFAESVKPNFQQVEVR